ncbi:unnamed protein product [Alopecurus aequalis]
MTREIHLGDASPKPKNVDGAAAPVVLPAPADGGGHGKVATRNKLSLVPLIFLIFFEVAGGPYGAEPAVQSAGPLFALLGFLIFPFIWAIPESLVTAELSTAMPGNGGFVVWADRAFGPFSGSLMGTWKYVSGAINGAAFPALCADYLARVIPAVADGGPRVATIVTFNVALSFLNYTGLSVVGWSAVALGIASLSPFVLMSGIALPKIRPHRWRVTAVDKDWKLFFNTLFWNLNYWDSVSTMAGEVENPGKTFPTALLSSVAMTSLGYLLPLMAATGAIDAPPENWGNGFFADAAGMIGGSWLKYWIEVGAVLSSIGLYSATLSSAAFQLLGMADLGLLPRVFALRAPIFNTPWSRHAPRVRHLHLAPNQAARDGAALPRAAGTPGQHCHVPRTLWVPRLRHGHRRLEGVRDQRHLHCGRRRGVLPHEVLRGERVPQVRHRRRRGAHV